MKKTDVGFSGAAGGRTEVTQCQTAVADPKSGHNVTARFGTKRGGSGMRSIRTAAEAEKILSGGYGVTTVTLECSCSPGEAIGQRWRVDKGACDDRRLKWAWSFDQDHFDPVALVGTYAFAAKLRAGGKRARARIAKATGAQQP